VSAKIDVMEMDGAEVMNVFVEEDGQAIHVISLFALPIATTMVSVSMDDVYVMRVIMEVIAWKVLSLLHSLSL
jgi:hypothetical protein